MPGPHVLETTWVRVQEKTFGKWYAQEMSRTKERHIC